MSKEQPRIMLLGRAAKELGVEMWQVQKAIECGQVTHYEKAGRLRLILREDLPKVREELKKVGYLE